MNSNNIIKLDRFREDSIDSDKPKKRKRSIARKKGSVYSRNGKLWVDFRYLGERVRERSGLTDTPFNRKQVRRQLDLVVAEIDNGIFKFAERFPHSKKKDHFSELEGNTVTVEPTDVIFSEYVEKWLKDMKPGMSESQIRDYNSILKTHLLPAFGNKPLSEFWSAVTLKKFVAGLQGTKNRYGKPLSAKRIQNIMIPLRVMVKDAISEYGWLHLHDPFAFLKLPKLKRTTVYPFSPREWKKLITFIPDWYKPYFEFAVHTGLRPSEQVALKWDAIDDEFIHIELSRVKNREKEDLKNEYSRRMIEIRPSLRKILADQKKLTEAIDSPYVFINTQGRPILQDKLRELFMRSMEKSGLKRRRMYETRHTFASWALGAGETPEWVARTLGHADTAMIYKTYGRYVPNLTRQDGSALEKLVTEATK